MPSAANPLRSVLLLIAVAAVAAAGMWAGRLVRGPAPRAVVSAAPKAAFAPGDAFPSVAVLDQDGNALTMQQAIGAEGAMVLFLDFDCAPCGAMVARWKRIKAEDPRGLHVIGVAHAAPEAVRDYRRTHAVPFPIFADTAWAYVRKHGVNDVPLCVAVDGDLRVRWVTFDPNDEPPAAIRSWVRPSVTTP